jgi:hypothetical protein
MNSHRQATGWFSSLVVKQQAKTSNHKEQHMKYHIQDLGGRLLGKFRFHKTWQISWAAERLSASQKRRRSFKIDNWNVSMCTECSIHTWCINQGYCMLYTWQMHMHLGKQRSLHHPHWGRVPWNGLCFSVWQKQVCTATLSSWSSMVSVTHTRNDTVKYN